VLVRLVGEDMMEETKINQLESGHVCQNISTFAAEKYDGEKSYNTRRYGSEIYEKSDEVRSPSNSLDKI
jgi:hypothetical protein